jgi:hypothetical protein
MSAELFDDDAHDLVFELAQKVREWAGQEIVPPFGGKGGIAGPVWPAAEDSFELFGSKPGTGVGGSGHDIVASLSGISGGVLPVEQISLNHAVGVDFFL